MQCWGFVKIEFLDKNLTFRIVCSPKNLGNWNNFIFTRFFLAAPKIKTNRHKFEQRIYLVSINLTSSIQVRDYAHLHQWHMLSSVFCTCSSCSGGTFFWKKCVHRMMILSFAFFSNEKFWRVNLDKNQKKKRKHISAQRKILIFFCAFFFLHQFFIIMYYYYKSCR